MILSTRIKRIMLLIITVFVLYLVGYGIYNELTFRIVGVSPSPSKITNLTPYLTIHFNKSLSSNVKVSGTENSVLSYKVSGRLVQITLNTPLPTQETTINITNINSKSGKHFADMTYDFTPMYIDYNSLPGSQKAETLNKQTDYSNSIQNNPLVQLLPFTGPNFEYSINYTVNYNTSPPSPIFIITAPDKQSQQDALSWIASQGVKTSTLNIQYVTGQP